MPRAKTVHERTEVQAFHSDASVYLRGVFELVDGGMTQMNEGSTMTDEQTFVEMCKRFGVILTPSENKQPDGLAGIASAWSIEAHKGPKQIGYYEFISDWYFDADGKFVGVGNWE